ncbi:MAG TPA: ATP-binding cassette domain-containing protein [Thiomicrospira sp.]|jgi:ABC-type iron transport system FetAB ATPase subunit|nr:ATP-binding cassette domain-containing protein [Thiomicrospira sp.]
MSDNANTPILEVKDLQATGMPFSVSLEVFHQEVWIISGPSGTGKSQFLKAIADLIEHTGLVSLKGQQQVDVCPEIWRSQVMYFSAETAWWADTVIEHFEHKPNEKDLLALGLSKAILSASTLTLSSGEKQRLALLRGLVYSPKVLLLDEVTANLDEETTLQVEAFLKHYLQNQPDGVAIIWVTHDMAQTQRMATKTTQLTFKKV